MIKIIRGKIDGRTIELSEDLGLAPGEEVEVRVRTLQIPADWGEGLKRCAGALADDPEWDVIMKEMHQARKLERRSIPEAEWTEEDDRTLEEIHQDRKRPSNREIPD